MQPTIPNTISRRAAVALMGAAAAMLPVTLKARVMDSSGWHIHLSAGQSNEETPGKGPWSPTFATQYLDRIFQVGRWNGDDMQIIPATEPLAYWDSPTGSIGHGSAISRAQAYIAGGYLPDGYNLLIVPASKGSTSILYWDGTASYNLDLWGDMVERVQLGLSLQNASLTLMIWRQIEADLNAAAKKGNKLHLLMPNAATYIAHTEAFLQRVRQEFGSVPISLTQGTDDYLAGNKTKPSFHAALLQIASDIGTCAVTDTAGLTSNYEVSGNTIDEIHFSAASQETVALKNIVDMASFLA